MARQTPTISDLPTRSYENGIGGHNASRGTKNLIDNFVLLSRDPRSGVAGILGVLQLNVCVKRFIQPLIGFWLRILCISAFSTQMISWHSEHLPKR